MSILIIDNNSDFSKEMLKQFGIEHINMPFSCDTDKVGTYENAFRPYLTQQNDVIYLSSGKMFCETNKELTQAVTLLNNEFLGNKIKVIDVNVPSCGYSFVAFSAMLKYKTDCTDDELIKYIEKLKKEVFVLTTTGAKTLSKYKIKDIVENSLIKTIILFGNNKVSCVDKVTTKKKLIQSFLEFISRNGENVADYSLFISYMGLEKEANELKLELEKMVGEDTHIFMEKLNEYNVGVLGEKSLSLAFHKRID